MPPSADPAVAERARALAAFGVATVHEAQGRRGLLTGVRLLVGPAFAGPAETAAIPAGDNLGIHALFRVARPGTVACIASAGEGAFGVLGDLLQTAAAERGLAGLVIDDGIRDMAQLAPPPSIAARGISARGTQKRRVLALNQPVALGGMLIRPGDWVVGDQDGVCVIAADRLDAVLVAAAARTRKEDGIRAELLRGRTTADVLGLEPLLEQQHSRSSIRCSATGLLQVRCQNGQNRTQGRQSLTGTGRANRAKRGGCGCGTVLQRPFRGGIGASFGTDRVAARPNTIVVDRITSSRDVQP